MDTAAREKEIEERLMKDKQAAKEKKEVEKITRLILQLYGSCVLWWGS